MDRFGYVDRMSLVKRKLAIIDTLADLAGDSGEHSVIYFLHAAEPGVFPSNNAAARQAQRAASIELAELVSW